MQFASESEVSAAGKHVRSLTAALQSVLFGQDELIEMVVTGVLAGGHILLEGLPGLGKTELVKGLARSLKLDARRIQFTPDLLPGDITGNPVLQEVDGRREFVFQPGPLFANIVLADEINRASPKTQSALLEAMQERRVTVLGETHTLPDAVLRARHPEPDRARGHLPAARGPARPLPVQARGHPQRRRHARENRRQPRTRRRARRRGGDGRRRDQRGDAASSAASSCPRWSATTSPAWSMPPTPASRPPASAIRYGASPRAALALATAAKARAVMAERTNASLRGRQAGRPGGAAPPPDPRLQRPDRGAHHRRRDPLAARRSAVPSHRHPGDPRPEPRHEAHRMTHAARCFAARRGAWSHPRSAQELMFREVADPKTNTYVEVNSMFGKLPATGYAPVRVTIANRDATATARSRSASVRPTDSTDATDRKCAPPSSSAPLPAAPR